MNAEETRRAKFSIPSIIAIVTAILSFTTGAFWGLVLAIIAILFGFLGVILSFSAKTRGGLVSAFSLFAGLVGIIAAAFKAVAWIV